LFVFIGEGIEGNEGNDKPVKTMKTAMTDSQKQRLANLFWLCYREETSEANNEIVKALLDARELELAVQVSIYIALTHLRNTIFNAS